MKHWDMNKKDTKKAIDYYREYYNVDGLFENSVYGGIKELLTTLFVKEKRLFVATSKPEESAKKILHQEVTVDRNRILEALRQAIRNVVPGDAGVTVSLHPIDEKQLRETGPDAFSRLQDGALLRCRPDSTVHTGQSHVTIKTIL